MTRMSPLGLALAAALCGCGSTPAPVVPKDPTPLAKCNVTKSQASPLVTEWPASEKAHLESLLAERVVVVSYSGCEMRILDSCRVDGSYAFKRTTLARDTVEIKNEDELYAKIPLGAASLQGELEASGRLAIHVTVAGQLRLEGDMQGLPDTPACRGATHVVTALSIGAFDMVSGGGIRAGGGVEVGSAGIGAQHKAEESTLKSAGASDACKATGSDKADVDCSSPIQVFLTPVAELEGAVASVTPRAAPQEMPPETRPAHREPVAKEPPVAEPEPVVEAFRPPEPVQPEPATEKKAPKPWDEPPPEKSVEVQFVPPEEMTDGELDRWMVMSPEGDVLCKLPCNRRVGNDSGIRLQLDADRKEDIKVLELPGDLGYSAGRRVQVQPDMSPGSVVVPIITTFGGVAATGGGIAMYVVGRASGSGCSQDEVGVGGNSGLCYGGAVTMVTGGILALVGGIWWYNVAAGTNGGTLDITLLKQEEAGLGLDLAPGYLTGTF
jgi:hypothetical protein